MHSLIEGLRFGQNSQHGWGMLLACIDTELLVLYRIGGDSFVAQRLNGRTIMYGLI
jgi:hypothetical protein